jgi:hypothetical protein
MFGVKTVTVSRDTRVEMAPISRFGKNTRVHYYKLRSEIRRRRRNDLAIIGKLSLDVLWFAPSLALLPWSDTPVRRWMNESKTCILGITVIAPAHKLP